MKHKLLALALSLPLLHIAHAETQDATMTDALTALDQLEEQAAPATQSSEPVAHSDSMTQDDKQSLINTDNMAQSGETTDTQSAEMQNTTAATPNADAPAEATSAEATPAEEQTDNAHHSIELKLSDFLMPGIEYNYHISPKFDIGISMNYLPTPAGSIKDLAREKLNSNIGSTQFSVSIDQLSASLKTFGGLAYYYPFGNGFNLSGGIFYSDIGASFKGSASIKDALGNQETATSETTLKVNPVNPYLGIGWKTGDRSESGLAFSTSLGVAFGTTPTLEATLDCSQTNYLSSDCNDKKASIKKYTKEFNDKSGILSVFPILSFGFAYRF